MGFLSMGEFVCSAYSRVLAKWQHMVAIKAKW